MSQIKISTENFNLVSKWRCSQGANGNYAIKEGPTTDSKVVSFAYSLPTGAIVNYVRVYATIGSPNSGAAVKTANGVTLSGDYMEQCWAEQDLATFDPAASSYTVTFKFKAYGSVYSDTSYHSGTLAFSEVYLLVDYTIPNSEWSATSTEVEAGGFILVNIHPQEESCSHELLVTFGSINETYVIEAGTTAFTLNIPYEWLEEIPNATSGVATLKLKTLLNGTELGLSDAMNLTIVCPEDVVPTIGTLTVEALNPAWGMYVQHYSSARLTLTGHEGAYGSTIQYATLSTKPLAGASWYMEDSERIVFEFSSAFTVTGTVEMNVSIVDSRGRSAATTVSIEVQPYAGPSITQTIQGRANAEGAADPQGTYVYAGAVYSYTAIGTNSATMQVYYREDGATDWVLGYEGQLASGEMVCFGGEFGTALVYELKYVITDDLAATSAVRTIGTAYAFMKWMPQSNAIGFGCIPRSNNMFEIGSDWRVYAYGKDIDSYAPVRNYVDNGSFIHPVNQRSIRGEVYPEGETLMYLDRWELVGFGVGDEVYALAEEGVGLHLTGVSADDYIEIRQRFEDYEDMAGQGFTIACSIDGVEHYYAFSMGNCPAGQNIGGLTFFSTETAHIAFRNSTATQITIQWIAMYAGHLTSETAPQYVPKGYGTELIECSRYFTRVGSAKIGWAASQVYYGMYIAANVALVTIPAANILRKNPTVSYGAWDVPCELTDAYTLYNADGTIATITAVTYTANQNGGINLRFTVEEATAGAVNTLAIMTVQCAVHLSADI